MKRFLTLFFIAMLSISCKKEYQPRTITDIHIDTYAKDSSSIRAIKAVSKASMFYADSNGNISKTKDGGETWETRKIVYNDSIIPHFRSIAVVNDTVFALSVANPALLYKVYNNTTKLVYKEEDPKVFYDAMHFFPDGKSAIAVGDPTEDCPSIIITSDGGNTWCKIACKELPRFEDGEAFFAASNTNIKVLGNTVWIVSGGKKARVLKSLDKGKTWEVYDTPIVQGNGPQGIYSVDFYDELNGIVIGGDYTNPEANKANKAITKDGGKTWIIVADNQEPGYKSCVQYIPSTEGKEVIAVGKTGISFSNDGGVHWKKISDESFYTIQFVDKHMAWLAGHEKVGKLILN